MIRGALALVLCAMTVACQPPAPEADAATTQQRAAPEYLNPNPRAPYSEGVRYNGMIFLAGKTGGQGEPGVQPETRRALTAIRDALERFGSSMDRVLQCNVYLVDMAEWGAMNEVYAEFFPGNKPARTTVGISLGGNSRVEIDCVAAA